MEKIGNLGFIDYIINLFVIKIFVGKERGRLGEVVQLYLFMFLEEKKLMLLQRIGKLLVFKEVEINRNIEYG